MTRQPCGLTTAIGVHIFWIWTHCFVEYENHRIDILCHTIQCVSRTNIWPYRMVNMRSCRFRRWWKKNYSEPPCMDYKERTIKGCVWTSVHTIYVAHSDFLSLRGPSQGSRDKLSPSNIWGEVFMIECKSYQKKHSQECKSSQNKHSQ